MGTPPSPALRADAAPDDEIVVSLVLVYLLLFQTPLTWWLAEPLRLGAPPQKADVIAVFAGGVGESGEAGGGYQERTKHAVDLYRAGFAPRIIFSSGSSSRSARPS